MMSRPLSSRQEAFCRHFATSGNAAAAARSAGYAEGSARQTGHSLLDKPWIIDRLRAIREHWQRTAQQEAAVLLARLEQAWDVAVAKESAAQMLQVIRLQAEIAGLTRKGAANRADLWPTPQGEGPKETSASAASGALAQAVRVGRERVERAFAEHNQALARLGVAGRSARASRKGRPATAARSSIDPTAYLQRSRLLREAIDDRRRLLSRALLPPAIAAAGDGADAYTMTNHDIVDPAPSLGDNYEVDACEAGRMAELADPTFPTRDSDSQV